jgi:hypothetical protein
MNDEIVAMDGKALRRAIQTGGVPYMVNAWAVRNGLVLDIFWSKKSSTRAPQSLPSRATWTWPAAS